MIRDLLLILICAVVGFVVARYHHTRQRALDAEAKRLSVERKAFELEKALCAGINRQSFVTIYAVMPAGEEGESVVLGKTDCARRHNWWVERGLN